MRKLLFFVLVFFLSVDIVYAFDLYSIDMDIKLDEYGTAIIDETWKTYVNDGTEIYHPYYNLNSSKINILAAEMDGEKYEIVENWDEESSLDEKAYKAGIYPNEHSGYDVVVGKTNYGKHTYKFKYEITNFISNLTDADMSYWTLIPPDFDVKENVTIKVSGPYTYPDTLDVWGYGMYGAPCYVKDGSIYLTSDGRKYKGDYLVLLAKYPANTFETTSKLSYDFDYYLAMAQDGAETYSGSISSSSDIPDWAIIIMALFPILLNVFIWSIIGVVVVRETNKNKQKYIFENHSNKVPKDVNNFREIPCNKDIYRAFWVADTYNLKKSKNDFFGVLLLKWIYDGNVTVNTLDKNGIFKNKKEDVITFNSEPVTANPHEKDLYRYMLEASGDGVLEKDEFKKWCRKHYSKILGWADKVIKYERDELVKEGMITDIITEKGLVFKYDVHSYQVRERMFEEAKQMAGLKKFLLEFSQIDKKEPIEVKLWHEYLMYAQIFGIASKVMERFKKLYPEIISEMENYNFDYNTFLFINSVSTTGVQAASAARTAAQSYSSGGGGFSSGGGGGGSFGGGFGGGSGSR